MPTRICAQAAPTQTPKVVFVSRSACSPFSYYSTCLALAELFEVMRYEYDDRSRGEPLFDFSQNIMNPAADVDQPYPVSLKIPL